MKSTHVELDNSQAIVGQWAKTNFGTNTGKAGDFQGVPLYYLCALLGLAEEYGEYLVAANTDESVDALGDMGIYLLDYCDRSEIVLAKLVPLIELLPCDYTMHPTPLIGRAIGLIQRAHLKQAQGIRGFDKMETFTNARNYAVASLYHALTVAAAAIDKKYFNDILRPVIVHVTKRNWKENQVDGKTGDGQGVPQVSG